MARNKRTDEPKAFQPVTVTHASVPESPNVNKDTHEKAMEKVVAPEVKTEEVRVTFYGAGCLILTINDRNYDVDFGQNFRYSTSIKALIEKLRELGYKEK